MWSTTFIAPRKPERDWKRNLVPFSLSSAGSSFNCATIVMSVPTTTPSTHACFFWCFTKKERKKCRKYHHTFHIFCGALFFQLVPPFSIASGHFDNDDKRCRLHFEKGERRKKALILSHWKGGLFFPLSLCFYVGERGAIIDIEPYLLAERKEIIKYQKARSSGNTVEWY